MINALHIENFKCFENQRFELGNLTLLTGLNGTGKSSVIQSMLLLRQSHQRQFLQAGGLLLNGDLIQLGTARDVFFEKAKNDEFGFCLDLGIPAEWRYGYNRQQADVGRQISKKVLDSVYDTSLFGDNFHYLPADRIGPQSAFETSDHSVRERQQLGTKGEHAPYFLGVFGPKSFTPDARVHPNTPRSNDTNLHNQVEAWMGEISPGVRINLENYPNIDRINLQYSFSIGLDITNNYRSTNVGFGITYTLPIVLALLASEAETLVLLENPEAHLHPRGQFKLGELMARAASCGVQVIVETHSEHILKGVQIALGGILKPVEPIIRPDQVCVFHLSRGRALKSTVEQYDTSQPSWFNFITQVIY